MTQERKTEKTKAASPTDHHLTAGRFPQEGRQNAYKSYTSASLCVRQTPEQFGGVSTD